jgi:hypothetical protein
MPGSLTVLGVRHHGPGSARAVAHALDAIRPDAVLIEGPPDAADILALAGDPTMTPPVALLVYSPESPQDASYYPFAEFSPEWQAIRWGLANNAATRFIDLACALRCKREPPPEPDADGTGTEDTQESDSTDTPPTRSDPLNALAEAAGYTDGEAWWGRLIEERRHHGDPLSAFEAVGEAMASAREQLGPTPHDPDEPAREAHMRKCIRAALREGHERIVVVCGAWHAPVLTAEAIQATTAKADDEQLKGLTKRKTAATWIPWTYERLSFHTGYGAGIHSPGWYEHLWRHPDRTNEQWLTRVARLMRQEQLDASPAAVIEAVRLAETLAAVRDRSSPGLEELSSATLAVLCHGQTLPLQIIHRELIVGSRLGTVPESAPSVPLQKDLAAQQKSLRLKLSEEVTTLDLDQRKETDLARSRLLHRLTLLAIPWGEREQDQRQRVSTFHEVWRLQWRPELAVAVLDAARWGNTVAQAAEASITDRAAKATTLDFVVSLLDHAMLADLPGSVATLIDRTAALAAVGAEIGHLMDAVPTLARILRYGDVRQTDAAMVRPLLAATIARTATGLLSACLALDDDAADTMRTRVRATQAALSTLDDHALTGPWNEAVARLADAQVHPLLCGHANRLLLDHHPDHASAARDRLARSLSPGNDPSHAAAWLEGFLDGSGTLLIHDRRLLGIIDEWVVSLPRDAFERACPIARRSFSKFTAPERRAIGQNIRRSAEPLVSDAADPDAPGYHAARGSLVDPVLLAILGALP